MLNFVVCLKLYQLQCDLAEPCDPRQQCFNLSPGYRCGPCPAGFKTTRVVTGAGIDHARRYRQQCEDVNECEDGRNGGCARNSICINTEVNSMIFLKCTYF